MTLHETLTTNRLAAQTTGLTPLATMAGSLTRDVSYGRLKATDLTRLQKAATAVVLRSGGLAFFFDTVRSALRHEHLDSKAFTVGEGRAHRSGEGLGWDREDMHSVFSTAPNSRAPSPNGSQVDLRRMKEGGEDVKWEEEDQQQQQHGHEGRKVSGEGAEEVPPSGFARSSLVDAFERKGIQTASDSVPEGQSAVTSGKDGEGELLTSSTAMGTHGRKKAYFPLLRRGYTRSKSRGGGEAESDGGSASHHGTSSHHGSHHSLLDRLRKIQEPVGLFESQRFVPRRTSLLLLLFFLLCFLCWASDLE